jgi:RNA methyltransferase, TrmH family
VNPLTIARDLQRRRARERTGLFTAEGVRCVEELIASHLEVRAVITSPALRATERGAALEELLRDAGRVSEISEVTDQELAAASDTDSQQGIIAIAKQPERSFEMADGSGLFLLLDGVQDPGNAGTILRTALAFGVATTVALPGTVDLWNPKVVRSAMGALFSHHAFHSTIAETLEYLRARAIPVWATSVAGDPVSRTGGDTGLAIVVGNEANGVSAEITAAAARNIGIPIHGVESLNVAVATGILLYALTTR